MPKTKVKPRGAAEPVKPCRCEKGRPPFCPVCWKPVIEDEQLTIDDA
jgi:hypothetical protein